MTQQENFLSSSDSHRIPFLAWLPDSPQAVLVIAHGMAEHAGRYQPLAQWLNTSGIAVVAIHHRGHGPHCTGQDLGHYADRDGWDKVVEDLHQVVRHARALAPGIPLTLFGHSMGSFIAQAYVQRHGEELDQLILCATNRINKPQLRASLVLISSIKAIKGPRHISPMVDNMTFGAFNKVFSPTAPAMIGSAGTPAGWMPTWPTPCAGSPARSASGPTLSAACSPSTPPGGARTCPCT